MPSSRFVSTVSMTVPSRTRCSGPAALIAGVWSGVRRCSAEGADAGKGVVDCCGSWRGRVRHEASGPRAGSDNRIGDLVDGGVRGTCPVRAHSIAACCDRRPDVRSLAAGSERRCWRRGSRIHAAFDQRRPDLAAAEPACRRIAPAGHSALARSLAHLALLALRAFAGGPDSPERDRRSEPALAPSSSLVAPVDPDVRRSA